MTKEQIDDKARSTFQDWKRDIDKRLKVGDPLSDDTDIGPVVNAKSLENMEGIVSRKIRSGAELLASGEKASSKGYFFSPTIVRNVKPDMEIAQEEVFGPVAPIMGISLFSL